MESTEGSSCNQKIFKYMQQDAESKWIAQNSRLARIQVLECHVTAPCGYSSSPQIQVYRQRVIIRANFERIEFLCWGWLLGETPSQRSH